MRFAPSLIVESVEYGEARWSFLNGEPRDRARFSIHQGYGRTQEVRDLPFSLPGFACRGTYSANFVIRRSLHSTQLRESLDMRHYKSKRRSRHTYVISSALPRFQAYRASSPAMAVCNPTDNRRLKRDHARRRATSATHAFLPIDQT